MDNFGLPWLLPEPVRVGLRFLHFAAFIAWLGAMLVVHLILRPQVAARGIPAPFFRLAWSAIAIISVTGSLLALSRVTGFETLFSTRWGQVLLIKVFFFLGLITVASYDSFHISPRLRRLSAEKDKLPVAENLLKQGDGQEGRPIYVAYRGAVYDLSTSPNWYRGLHMGQHRAGQDLTQELTQAPHGMEMLARFPQIKPTSEMSPAYQKLWRRFQWLAWVALVLGISALLAAAFWY